MKKIYKLISGSNRVLFVLAFSVLFGTAFSQITYTFISTGNIQTINLQGGAYKVECWGADGSAGTYYSAQTPNNLIDGGKGGYSVGYVNLTSPVTWYIGVGGTGSNILVGNNPGGYNGGGNSSSAPYQAGSGGGA